MLINNFNLFLLFICLPLLNQSKTVIMNTAAFSNTFKLLCSFVFISLSFILQAQTVHLIPNPQGYDLDPYLPGWKFSDCL